MINFTQLETATVLAKSWKEKGYISPSSRVYIDPENMFHIVTNQVAPDFTADRKKVKIYNSEEELKSILGLGYLRLIWLDQV